jgi:hypothetical protein
MAMGQRFYLYPIYETISHSIDGRFVELYWKQLFIWVAIAS